MSETLIANIIREVAEIERDPLPGQPDDEMRVTADELRAILETAWNTRTPDAEAERLRAALEPLAAMAVALDGDPEWFGNGRRPDDYVLDFRGRLTAGHARAARAALGDRRMPDAQTLEIRRNDDGTLDEIVATGASVHLEQMGGNHWWMSIEAGSRCVHVNLTTAKATIRAECDDD